VLIAFFDRDPVDLALDWAPSEEKPIPVILPANDKRPGGDWEASVMVRFADLFFLLQNLCPMPSRSRQTDKALQLGVPLKPFRKMDCSLRDSNSPQKNVFVEEAIFTQR
jgi:hypothetical protein